MSSNNSGDGTAQHLVGAYEKMVQRAKGVLDQARSDALPTLRQLLETSKEKAVELGELTREEAEKVGEYLQRDIEDAANYLSYTGKGLGDWLNFDLDILEAKFREAFPAVVDHTRIELDRLAARAREADEIHTGQLVSPGTLRCTACEQPLHFGGTGHVPPCPKCHATIFTRVTN